MSVEERKILVRGNSSKNRETDTETETERDAEAEAERSELAHRNKEKPGPPKRAKKGGEEAGHSNGLTSASPSLSAPARSP